MKVEQDEVRDEARGRAATGFRTLSSKALSSLACDRASYSRLHIFQIFRTTLRFGATPLVLCLAAPDFYFMPDEAWLSFLTSAAIAVYIWLAFAVMVKYERARRNISLFVYSLVVLFSLQINLFIYKTDGVASPYIAGIFMSSCAFICLFRIGKLGAVLSQIMLCGPTIALLFLFSSPDQIEKVYVVAPMLASMVFVAFISHNGHHELRKIFERARRMTANEIERHRRTEFLKSHSRRDSPSNRRGLAQP